MAILDAVPEPRRMYSTFPQPTSFAHSRKGSYPGPPLTLAGVGGGSSLGGQTMLGGGLHQRSDSDLSLPGGMGIALCGGLGAGAGGGSGGYDLGENAQWGGNDFFPSSQTGQAFQVDTMPSQTSLLLHNTSSDRPSYAHLTRQDQLFYSAHSSGSSASPASASSAFQPTPFSSILGSHHSRHSSLSSIGSSGQSQSHSHSRSGSLSSKSNLGSMSIEPDQPVSVSGSHDGYLDYAPSSVQVDHTYGEGCALPENGTLPPSAMNLRVETTTSSATDGVSAPAVPSQGEAGSPTSSGGRGGEVNRTRSKLQLRQRAGSVRDGSRSRSGSMASEADGVEVAVPAALLEEAENQLALGKEADKDKAKMAFSEFWLKASYTRLEKATVSRQALFHWYNISCERMGLKAVNSASFGKAVRSAFLGIQTRRLGVRGNSKYHYCGIRPNTLYEVRNLATFGEGPGGTHWNLASSTTGSDSTSACSPDSDMEESDHFVSEEEAARLDDEDSSEEQHYGQHAPSSGEGMLGFDMKRSHSMADLRTPSQRTFDDLKTPTAPFHPDLTGPEPINALASGSNFGAQPPTKQPSPPLVNAAPPRPQTMSGAQSRPRSSTTNSYGLNRSPDQPSVVSLANYPSLAEAGPLPPHTIPGRAARSVWVKSNIHLDSLLDAVRTLRFDQFEHRLRSFWRLPDDERDVCHSPSMAGIMSRAETIAFDAILEHLKTQAFNSLAPGAIDALRLLSRDMEKILLASLEGYGTSFVEPRVELGARFGHLLQRFLDIHQICLALGTLLSKDNSILQIINSFEAINFESVRNHVALVCNCRPDQLTQILEVDLRQQLKTVAYQSGQYDLNAAMGQRSTEEQLSTGMRAVHHLMDWVESTADRLLAGPQGEGEGSGKTSNPRSVLIRWSFVTSEIMRDLTIRSDPSFGSFQILKIAFDEWFSFKVLRMVALSTASVAASVETDVQPVPPLPPAAAQTFFALSPLVEDAWSQHPPTYNPAPPQQQNLSRTLFAPNSDSSTSFHNPDYNLGASFKAYERLPQALQQSYPPPPPVYQADSWRRRNGGGTRSRSSSTASSAYDPTQEGYQQPPRPSQFRSHSYSSDSGASGIGAGAPSLFFSQAPSPEELVSGEDLGDLGRMIEGSHLGGGMEGVDSGMMMGGQGW